MNNFLVTQKYYKIITIILVFLSLILLVRPLSLIGLHIPLEYNEGWNAYFADAAVNSHAPSDLYPPWLFSITNNYPPFSFYIVGYVSKLFGDEIISGRIVNIFSVFLVTFLIYSITNKITNSIYPSLIASFSFFIYTETVFWRYFAIDDPQWLANSISLLGFFLCLHAFNKKIVFVLAAFLIIFSGFIKHNLIALPIATFIYIYSRDKNSSYIFILSAFFSLMGFIIFSYMEYGANFFVDVFQNKRIMNVYKAINTYKKVFELFPLFVALYIIIKNRKECRDKIFVERFIIPFVSIALFFGIFQASAEGVDYNCFFELLISLSLALGLCIQNLSECAEKNKSSKLIAFVVFSVFVFSVPVELMRSYSAIKNIKEESYYYSKIISVIDNDKYSAICQDLSLCYWGHKKELVDFFNTDQKIKLYHDDSIFDSVFKNNDVGLIEVKGNDVDHYIKKYGYNEFFSDRGIIIFKKGNRQ